jgi:hypothetical protein
MAVTIGTGTVKVVRYCGRDYTVRPSAEHVYGKKQVWDVYCGQERIACHANTRSKAVHVIHEHAVSSGTYPAGIEDGLPYGRLVTVLCR